MASGTLPSVAEHPQVTAFKRRQKVKRGALVLIALAFSALVMGVPVAAIFARAFQEGVAVYWTNIVEPDTLYAIWLTVLTALIVLPINIVYGVAVAWLITRYRFPGRRVLLTIIELPFSISPIVAGLCYLLIYGGTSVIGSWADEWNIQLMFNLTGIVLVSLFVTCPFVARELIPLMQVSGKDQEEAALTLGATGWQTFRHVTLPNIRWALLYGAILANARVMGEFGAVSVVSGNIRGETMTLPLQVQLLYDDYNATGAFAAATVLTLIAVITLVLRSLIEARHPHRH
ncbi:sulfate ABC transporter permease subunit CysW [Roseibium sp. CAU 1637]|uniref:Sulfate ABC transporter permease subunit CysW n=1 Tax=Roseibium limicola TaxID=2816037 RepID=A0A939EP53_9HYPH|nr:sulfate ABC transporter permease subunit CysW [Roseibium limicola]MBO0346345.1 sulfate ABC transporter permease subunit CysW [Roseibium limicola]